MRKAPALTLVTLVAALGLVVAAQARSVSSQGMYGISITNYKVTRTHTASISVKIRGLKMGAMSKKNVVGRGHWNIYVNGKLNSYSVNAKTGTTKTLKKGDYKVYVALANNDGTPLKEPARSKTITVMVD